MYSVKELLKAWYINVAKNISVVMGVSEKESNMMSLLAKGGNLTLRKQGKLVHGRNLKDLKAAPY